MITSLCHFSNGEESLCDLIILEKPRLTVSSCFAVHYPILLIWAFDLSHWQAAALVAEVFKLKYADMAAQVNIPAHGIQTYMFQDWIVTIWICGFTPSRLEDMAWHGWPDEHGVFVFRMAKTQVTPVQLPGKQFPQEVTDIWSWILAQLPPVPQPKKASRVPPTVVVTALLDHRPLDFQLASKPKCDKVSQSTKHQCCYAGPFSGSKLTQTSWKLWKIVVAAACDSWKSGKLGQWTTKLKAMSARPSCGFMGRSLPWFMFCGSGFRHSTQ